MIVRRVVLGIILCLMHASLQAAEREATPVSSISVKSGFQVELLRSAQPGESSWISMTFDDQGRIIMAAEYNGLIRMTLGKNPDEVKFEKLAGTEQLRHCRGVLFAHQSIYACATDGEGIYRLRDLDGDGTYEDIQLICQFNYEQRHGHGANQMRLGPDGMIYVAVGNDVYYPEHRDPNSPYRDSENDWLLPNPHDGSRDERTGYILRMTPEGKVLTVLAGGLRNQMDVAFNSDGEMFTWDADMEWDVGMPWYRPTRINHIVSAGEYGWRFGTGKWPAWYPDSLPSNLDTALGSPTGITFGTESSWPGRYQQAMYAADWQHGRLLLIDMNEKGASYQGRYEVLAEGSPLNICDLEFGSDGALYFITGGRGSQSGLYRITMTPEGIEEGKELEVVKSQAAAEARKIRHELEELHIKKDSTRLPFIWSHLASEDIWIRFAARLALECQPVGTWRSKVISEPDSKARHTAIMALARVGESSDQPIIFEGIKDWKFQSEDPDELLWFLRTLELTLIRQGIPEAATQQELVKLLNQIPPSDRFSVNWLLGELLVALEAPTAVEFLIGNLSAGSTQEEQIQFAKTLMRVKGGWTPESRKTMFNWLTKNKRLPGGRSMNEVLLSMREDFSASLSDAERLSFQNELEELQKPANENEFAVLSVNRPLVRNWTVDELEAELAKLDSSKIATDSGLKFFSEALCLRCHQFGDRGSHIGPDLSNVGKRMDRRAILESIIEPSRQIDPKYSSSIYLLENGQVVSGRVCRVNKDHIGVEIDALTGKSVNIPRAEIAESKLSPVSPMPQNLLNVFTAEEIYSLLSYLQQSHNIGKSQSP